MIKLPLNIKKKDMIWLALAVGLFICAVIWPFNKKKEVSNKNNEITTMDTNANSTAAYNDLQEEKLQKILNEIQGAGKVKVMITMKNAGNTTYAYNQTDHNSKTNEKDGQNGERNVEDYSNDQSFVILQDENGVESGVIECEQTPEIEGILVVCEGGDNATVSCEISDAICALFDVPVHKIKVLKME